MENPASSFAPKELYKPTVSTATVTSSAINVNGYPSAMFCVYYGDSADTLSATVYWTGKIQSCATESGTYADVGATEVLIATTNLFGLINAPTEDQKIYVIGYNGTDDWVKVVVTPTGTHTNGTPIGVFAILGMPRSVVTDVAVNP